jgi:glycosyltransferase involved in cell wall biosynthesis
MSSEDRANLAHQFGLDSRRPIIGLVGRLSEEKGHQVLLSAVPRVLRYFPLTQFLFVGDGPLRRALEQQIEQVGLTSSVRLVGFVDNVRKAMCLSDLMVQPSLSESLPLSILEAMAQGKAVVATDVGSIREAVVAGETGLLVPPQDPEALAEAMIAMLGDPSRRIAMGEHGAQLVQDRFSMATRVSQVQQVYQRVFDQRHFPHRLEQFN